MYKNAKKIRNFAGTADFAESCPASRPRNRDSRNRFCPSGRVGVSDRCPQSSQPSNPLRTTNGRAHCYKKLMGVGNCSLKSRLLSPVVLPK